MDDDAVEVVPGEHHIHEMSDQAIIAMQPNVAPSHDGICNVFRADGSRCGEPAVGETAGVNADLCESHKDQMDRQFVHFKKYNEITVCEEDCECRK